MTKPPAPPDATTIDGESLGRWIRDHVAPFEGGLEATPFEGGRSNPTYEIVAGATRYVLRISETSRQSAEALCDQLRAANGACLVLANPRD